MRKLAILAAATLLAFATGPVSAAAPSSPFIGTWTSTDPVDGSTQHLTIVGGTNLAMSYLDEFGTTCVDIGAPTVAFSGELTGRVDGNVLVGEWKVGGCGPRIVLRAADRFAWIFLYDAGSDTLYGAINDGPATWTRS